jgi:hypothetical protein
MGDEAKTKLTLLAEALGFDQSARAVDVLAKAEAELAKKGAELEGAGLLGIDAGALDPRLTATEPELAVLRGLFVELLAESRKQTEALQSGGGVVHIGSYQPNAKNFGADALSFKRRSISGESRARTAKE